jgi:glucokinase
MATILSGDIGGTHVRLELAHHEQDATEILAMTGYLSADHTSLADIVRQFLVDHNYAGSRIDSACFAVAGPIHQGEVTLTNLPWKINQFELERDLSIATVGLINDFAAVGYGLDEMQAEDLVCLHSSVHMDPEGLRAVVGAGTGLGVGFSIRCNGKTTVFPTEGGHIDFAPINHEQQQLLHYLKQKLHRVSVERLCSGYGLVNIYHAVRDVILCEQLENEALANLMNSTEQPGAAIAQYAIEYNDPIAKKTLDLFVDIYASMLGNVALMMLPMGGLYVAGGIAPKLISLLQQPSFLQVLHDKGRMSDLIRRIPIHVVMKDHIGLLGARRYTMQLL